VGIGGLLAAALTRAGATCVVLLRPETLAGYPGRITVESAVLGDFDVDVPATSTLDRDVDVLWVATKATQLEPALALAPAESVGVATVIPLMNGVDHVARLRELYPPGRFEARRFRANVVVQTVEPVKDFVEDAWIDRTVAIGADVQLRITGHCPRCVMTTLAQADLPKDPGILRAAAQHNHANVGVYASVVSGGTIRRGDVITLME